MSLPAFQTVIRHLIVYNRPKIPRKGLKPLKNAVLQGFSLKNRKTCKTTNRVIEQVYYSGKPGFRRFTLEMRPNYPKKSL
jgi:hypothetical protein